MSGLEDCQLTRHTLVSQLHWFRDPTLLNDPHPRNIEMASLLPLLSELLPMIMPSSMHIVRAKDIEPQHPTVEGPAIERPAIVDKCSMSATGQDASSVLSNMKRLLMSASFNYTA